MWSELKFVCVCQVVYARSGRLTIFRPGQLEHLVVTLVGCDSFILVKSDSSICSARLVVDITSSRDVR